MSAKMSQFTIPFRLYICLVFIIIYLKTVNMAAVMSVDLGSEWMKVIFIHKIWECYNFIIFLSITLLQVGVVSPGVPMEIALNKESKRKTPNFISFRDNTRLFGEDAQTLGLRYPKNCFGYLTDLIGKTIDNPVVKTYK